MYALALRMSWIVVSLRKEWMSSPNLRYRSTPHSENPFSSETAFSDHPQDFTMSTMMVALSFRSILTRSDPRMEGFTLR